MDLHTIEAVLVPRSLADVPPPSPGTAWLAGGTWLYSEPQPHLRRLVDLTALGWAALEPSDAGLRIGATCTIAELEAFRADWPAAPLFAACCRALLGSFKIRHVATVGGNICLALAAAPMLALTVALDGAALVIGPGGERRTPMDGFALGPQRTVLRPGEVVRAVDLPVAALLRRTAWRQISLTALGRSAALLAATLDPAGAFALTITGSTPHPMRFDWPAPPDPETLDAAIAALPPGAWYDDVHGAPAWRRHVTRRLAAELLTELTL